MECVRAILHALSRLSISRAVVNSWCWLLPNFGHLTQLPVLHAVAHQVTETANAPAFC